MKTFIWIIATLVFFLVSSLTFTIFFGFENILDLFFAQFSCAIVSILITILGINKGIQSVQAAFILFISQIFSFFLWIFINLLIGLFEINLYSTTALIFDSMIGIFASLSIGYALLEHYNINNT